MQQGPITIEAQQGAALLVIKFVPGAAGTALRLKAQDLTDRVLPLEQVLGEDGRKLRAGIIEAEEAQAKTAFAETWLLEKVRNRPKSDPVLAAMIGLMRDQPGISIAQMADAIGYSERHTRNLFRAGMGINPKQFARILRFQLLLQHLAASGGDAASDPMLVSGRIPVPDWADVAHAFGYADQSHMNIEFRARSGFTPGGYVAAFRGMENFLPASLGKS